MSEVEDFNLLPHRPLEWRQRVSLTYVVDSRSTAGHHRGLSFFGCTPARLLCIVAAIGQIITAPHELQHLLYESAKMQTINIQILLGAALFLQLCHSFALQRHGTRQSRLQTFEDGANHLDRAVHQLEQKTQKIAISKTNPRAINKAIVETFSAATCSSAEIDRLKTYLAKNLGEMNQINVITLMHRCGKRRLDVFSFIDIDTTVNLLDVEKSGVATAQGIANALYSLQSMTSLSTGSLRLISVLSEQLTSCKEIFDGQAISNALYGLKGMSSDSYEIARILSAIAKTMKRCILNQNQGKLDSRDNKSDTFGREIFRGRDENSNSAVLGMRMTTQGIGSAFIGLQGMSSTNSDVKLILSSLASSIGMLTSSNTALDSQAVANILVGLRNSFSIHSEVREVLAALCKNLKRNPAVLRDIKPRELSMALQGLQGMSSDHPQVDQLLQVLCDGLDYRTSDRKGIEQFNNGGFEFRHGDELGAALNGLKLMSAENLQVRRLLKHIYRAIKWGVVSPQMQPSKNQEKNKDSSENSAEEAFPKKSSSRKSATGSTSSSGYLRLNEQNIANCLYGLQGMDCRTEEVRMILSALSGAFSTFEGRLSGRSMANALYGEGKELELVILIVVFVLVPLLGRHLTSVISHASELSEDNNTS